MYTHMVGWHDRCNGHDFGQTSGDGEGQGGLACCSPWGCKESDMTEQLTLSQIQKCVIFVYILRLILGVFYLSKELLIIYS